jgi:hypothetical protein
VDDRQLWLEKLNVTGCLSDEILDVKREANMKHIDTANGFVGSFDIDASYAIGV